MKQVKHIERSPPIVQLSKGRKSGHRNLLIRVGCRRFVQPWRQRCWESMSVGVRTENPNMTYNRRQEKQTRTMILRRRRICNVLRIQNGMATKARSVRIFRTSKKVQNATRSIHLPSMKSHGLGSPHLNANTNTEEIAHSPTRPPRP